MVKELTIDECFYLIRNGANIKQGVTDGGFPITRIETISNDVFNRDRMGYAGITDVSKYNSYVLEDGDLLMSHINSIQYLGRTVLYKKQNDETIIHGINLLLLKARRDIINPAYAKYYFYSPIFKKQLARITKKSVNQASFTVSELKKIKLTIQNLEVQNHIVETLDRIEYVIQLRTQELQTLDELIKARFVEMFGDEQNCAILNNLCKFINGDRGKNYPSGKDIVSSGIPFINAGHLVNNAISFEEMNYLTEEKYNSLNSGKIQRNDILYCLRGSLGKKALVNIEKGAIASSLLILRANTDEILPTFLLYSLEQPYILEQMNKANNGSSQPNLSAQSVKNYEIILPPIERQNEFAEFIKEVDKSKVVVQKALYEAQLLFDSLMQQYFG